MGLWRCRVSPWMAMRPVRRLQAALWGCGGAGMRPRAVSDLGRFSGRLLAALSTVCAWREGVGGGGARCACQPFGGTALRARLSIGVLARARARAHYARVRGRLTSARRHAVIPWDGR